MAKHFSTSEIRVVKRRKKVLPTVCGALLLLLTAGALWISFSDPQAGIRNETKDVLGIAALPRELQIAPQQLEQTFISPELKADFDFNAIAPMWHTTQQSAGATEELAIRTSADNRNWSEWLLIEATLSAKDGDRDNQTFFPETPIFIEGRYFQYRVNMRRQSAEQQTPTISNVKMNFIDSRQSTAQKITQSLRKAFTKPALAASSGPQVVSRADWGSPDPNGDKFKNASNYWAPTYKPATQVFLHHTATASAQSDPKATIRGIWDYHANTLGWGDIGYNFVLDDKGTVYEGRYGGSNVVGGHVYGYNVGSLGISVLGCFEVNATCKQLNGGSVSGPTNATLDRLTDFLSYKTTLAGINPDSSHSFCKADDTSCLQLATIAAHRDGGGTECNGQLFYDKLTAIRQKTLEKNNQDIWGLKNKITHLQKATAGNTQQLFYTTEAAAYATTWGAGSGLQKKKIMSAPSGEKILGIYKLTEPDTTQKVYITVESGVYESTIVNSDYTAPHKLVTLPGTKQATVDLREESGTLTHRLYVLAADGPYEFWWRDGAVSAGSRLWNITNGIDVVKSRDTNDIDELYVATKGEVYRMKWPIGGGIERKLVSSVPNIVAIDKQTLTGGTELLYTATTTGVHETWWKPGTGFSNPAKIVRISGLPVVDVKKTLSGTNNQQLYVASQDQVQEFWWGPGSNGIQGGKLIRISQGDIVNIDKDTRGAYQNLYTAHNSFINETWWGNGKLGNGPAIVDVK